MTPELRQRFPYMFEATEERPHVPALVPEFEDGWLPIFVRLCEAVDAVLLPEEKPVFRWHQVKQKWGRARFYWGIVGKESTLYVDFFMPGVGISTAIEELDDDVTRRVMPLIRAAEDEAANTCEWCEAQPAAIDRTGGYWMTLCADHTTQRMREGKLA